MASEGLFCENYADVLRILHVLLFYVGTLHLVAKHLIIIISLAIILTKLLRSRNLIVALHFKTTFINFKSI